MYQAHRFLTENDLRSYARRIVSEVLLPAFQNGKSTVLLLEGPMGVGKSTLARFILEEAGIDEGFSGSPTYPIILEYQTPVFGLVAHIDLYRLETEDELSQIGIDEMLSGQGPRSPGVFLIEWGSKFKDALNSKIYPNLKFVSFDLDFEGESTIRFCKCECSN